MTKQHVTSKWAEAENVVSDVQEFLDELNEQNCKVISVQYLQDHTYEWVEHYAVIIYENPELLNN